MQLTIHIKEDLVGDRDLLAHNLAGEVTDYISDTLMEGLGEDVGLVDGEHRLDCWERLSDEYVISRK